MEKFVLLPCPFCGSNDVHVWTALENITGTEKEYVRVNCANCQASSPKREVGRVKYVVKKWNARAEKDSPADCPICQKFHEHNHGGLT